jgi:hypothetical protein
MARRGQLARLCALQYGRGAAPDDFRPICMDCPGDRRRLRPLGCLPAQWAESRLLQQSRGRPREAVSNSKRQGFRTHLQGLDRDGAGRKAAARRFGAREAAPITAPQTHKIGGRRSAGGAPGPGHHRGPARSRRGGEADRLLPGAIRQRACLIWVIRRIGDVKCLTQLSAPSA